jgi:hypothetical protein
MAPLPDESQTVQRQVRVDVLNRRTFPGQHFREAAGRDHHRAIAANELVPTTNPRQLARTIEAVVGGSMLSWAFYQQGAAAKWMRDDLNAVLKPYLT